MRVGLLVISTGLPYHRYIEPLLHSIEKHFLTSCRINTYLWSDAERQYPVTRQFHLDKRPWPYPTLHRYHTFLGQSDELARENDFLFYLDVDMLLVDDIGGEILGDGITATLHPCVTTPEVYLPPFESDPRSAAFVPRPRYCAGGFQGGTTEAFLRMARVIRSRIDDDERKGIIAIWHDESHYNRYLFENPPAVLLTPSYCFPDQAVPGGLPEVRAHFVQHVWQQDFPPKILAITKPAGTQV